MGPRPIRSAVTGSRHGANPGFGCSSPDARPDPGAGATAAAASDGNARSGDASFAARSCAGASVPRQSPVGSWRPRPRTQTPDRQDTRRSRSSGARDCARSARRTTPGSSEARGCARPARRSAREAARCRQRRKPCCRKVATPRVCHRERILSRKAPLYRPGKTRAALRLQPRRTALKVPGGTGTVRTTRRGKSRTAYPPSRRATTGPFQVGGLRGALGAAALDLLQVRRPKLFGQLFLERPPVKLGQSEPGPTKRPDPEGIAEPLE